MFNFIVIVIDNNVLSNYKNYNYIFNYNFITYNILIIIK